MVLEKNTQIINAICRVQIRSTDNVVYMPALARLYHTPSKIQYAVDYENSKNGNLHHKTLRISYPGLSSTDFAMFDEMMKGRYQVFITLEDKRVFEIGNTRYPMSCSPSYNLRSGHELVFKVSSPLSITYIGNDTGKPGIDADDEMFDYDFDFDLA